MRGSESTSKPRIPWRASAGTACSRRAFSAGRSSSRSASRDRPDASTVPSSSSTEKVIRRCAGRSSSDQSAALMRTPRSRSIASASTSSSGPERGVTSASSAAAVSGIGTSGVRSRFGKRAQQRDDELRAKRGHEPLEVRLPHRPERRERDVDRDAVGRRAGVEAVGQRELQRALLPARRPVTVVGRDVALDQHLHRVVEQRRLGLPRPLPPAVEVTPADDVLRYPRVEERRPHRLAREQVAPPRPRLERLDLLHPALVLAHERVALVPIALDERAADEQLARGRRVDPPVLDGPRLRRSAGRTASPARTRRRRRGDDPTAARRRSA